MRGKFIAEGRGEDGGGRATIDLRGLLGWVDFRCAVDIGAGGQQVKIGILVL
jgi:hypothetical protein